MAYDALLDERLQNLFASRKTITRKKMFGGTCYLLHGNMLCGVWKDSLIVRLDPDEYEAAIKKPYARKFDITGKPMKGWLLVDSDGIKKAADLTRWVNVAEQFVKKLPKK